MPEYDLYSYTTSAKVDADKLAGTLATITQRMREDLPRYKGGGWEVVSHSVCRIDGLVVLSFLISRGK